jgi:Divergent InlB B-repeat domain
MRKLVFSALMAFAMAAFLPLGHAQSTLAPLLLYTNGPGEISPFSSGQLLQVGQTYDLEAAPDPGFLFSSWQSVVVFAITQSIPDGAGVTNTVVSVSVSPVPDYTFQADLQFTMQPVEVVLSNTGLTITQGTGWQANFAPVPEPSSLTLLVCGLTSIILLRRRTLINGRFCSRDLGRNKVRA